MIQIIKIESPDDKDLSKIIFSDNTEITAGYESVLKYHLWEERQYEPGELESLKIAIESDEAYKKALYYVCRSIRTTEEVRQKLLTMNFSNPAIQNTIDKLTENNYLNDKVYVEKYIRNAIKLTKKSGKAIIYELIQKGIDHGDAEDIYNSFNINQNNIAYDILKKKFSGIINKNNKQNLTMKMKAFLYNKGFSKENTDYAIEKLTGKGYNEEYFE